MIETLDNYPAANGRHRKSASTMPEGYSNEQHLKHKIRQIRS